jgi:hypothetical protein
VLNCHDATRLLSQSQERVLSLAERARLRMHLAFCAGCRRFEQQLGFLRGALRVYARRAPDDDASQ